MTPRSATSTGGRPLCISARARPARRVSGPRHDRESDQPGEARAEGGYGLDPIRQSGPQSSGGEVAAARVVADEARELRLLLGDRASAAPELELVRAGSLETLK